jgi:hypothetical protein
MESMKKNDAASAPSRYEDRRLVSLERDHGSDRSARSCRLRFPVHGRGTGRAGHRLQHPGVAPFSFMEGSEVDGPRKKHHPRRLQGGWHSIPHSLAPSGPGHSGGCGRQGPRPLLDRMERRTGNTCAVIALS